jgi:hypothetical protein
MWSTPGNANNLIRTSPQIRMDLPSWFRGPLRVDMAKTGNDQWTIAWETFPEASSYAVLVRIDGTLINVLNNVSIPPGQTQLNLGGLTSGTRYSVYVSGAVMWNGKRMTRAGSTLYTAP